MKPHTFNDVFQYFVPRNISILLILFLTSSSFTFFVEASTIDLSVLFVLGDETPASFFVGNIPKQTAKFESFLVPNEKLRSTMLDNRGLAPDFLHLNDLGDLYTIKRLDRDDEANICGPLDCCSQPRCNLSFDAIFIRPRAESIKVSVTVQLVDHNDNAPNFPQGHDYILSIPEATQLNRSPKNGVWMVEQAYSLPIAKDADSLENGVVRYQISGEGIDSGFFLLSSPQSACFPCLLLSNMVHLDFENPEHHNFSLNMTAIDGGAIPKSSYIIIHIQLIDMNDHAPVFAHASDTINIIENQTYYEPVYTMKAVDADSERNAKVRYTISSPVKHSKFVLDVDTGELFVHSLMDYETFEERRIELQIVASDDGRPTALSSTFSLTVIVTDTNDNFPEVVVQQNNTIMENGEANSLALQMTIKDVDDVSQGKVFCRLEEGQRKLRLISVVGETFLSIWTVQSLDYEETPFVYFQLICHDDAEPAANITFALAVKVGNRNDNAPVFYSAQKTQTNTYHLVVSEIEKTLRSIFLPRVVDPDGGALVFSIDSKSDDSPFQVKSDTGAVYLKTPLDYETTKYHEFFLIVSDKPIVDSGDSVFTSKALVKVSVKDHNDCNPRLTSPSVIPIKRDTPTGYLVSQVVFIDNDMDGQQEVSAKLLFQTAYPSNGTIKEYFDLKENGALVTLVSMEKESISMFLLQVLAIDQGDAKIQRSTTATLTVVVEKVAGDTLRITNPFPGSIVKLTPVDASNHVFIHIDYFDSRHKHKNDIKFRLQTECNGSSLLEIDAESKDVYLRSGIIKSNNEFLSNAIFEVCIEISDSDNRSSESQFFIEIGWSYQKPGQALWPADSADASADVYPDLLTQERFSNSSYRFVSASNHDPLTGQKQNKFSLSNIIIFLLILAFSLAAGFALFAVILWARAKQATNAAQRRRNGQQPTVAQKIATDAAKMESAAIWAKSEKKDIALMERCSTSSHQHLDASVIPSPEIHYAILTSENHQFDLQNTTFLSPTTANDASKPGGPIVAYFDLIVSSPSNSSNGAETHLVSLPGAGCKVGLDTTEHDSTSPAVSCYLVL